MLFVLKFWINCMPFKISVDVFSGKPQLWIWHWLKYYGKANYSLVFERNRPGKLKKMKMINCETSFMISCGSSRDILSPYCEVITFNQVQCTLHTHSHTQSHTQSLTNTHTHTDSQNTSVHYMVTTMNNICSLVVLTPIPTNKYIYRTYVYS